MSVNTGQSGKVKCVFVLRENTENKNMNLIHRMESI